MRKYRFWPYMSTGGRVFGFYPPPPELFDGTLESRFVGSLHSRQLTFALMTFSWASHWFFFPFTHKCNDNIIKIFINDERWDKALKIRRDCLFSKQCSLVICCNLRGDTHKSKWIELLSFKSIMFLAQCRLL